MPHTFFSDYLLSELMACRMTGGFQEKENDEVGYNEFSKKRKFSYKMFSVNH